jgi:hypothetical protein
MYAFCTRGCDPAGCDPPLSNTGCILRSAQSGSPARPPRRPAGRKQGLASRSRDVFPHLGAGPPATRTRSQSHTKQQPAGARPGAAAVRPQQQLMGIRPGVSRSREAVAQTPGEPARPSLRVGSENGDLVRHAHVVHPEVVAHGCAGVPFRERAAAFPRRLYATASRESDSRATASSYACFRPEQRVVWRPRRLLPREGGGLPRSGSAAGETSSRWPQKSPHALAPHLRQRDEVVSGENRGPACLQPNRLGIGRRQGCGSRPRRGE